MTGDVFAAASGPKRRRRARSLSAQAEARLAAAVDVLPRKGDEITIRWPGGPHDFTMFFEREELPAPPWPG